MIYLAVLFLCACGSLWSKCEMIVFLGPKGCPWSEKFSLEILSQNSFRKSLENEVSLIINDFSEEPMRHLYGIEEFPMALLLTEEKKKIAAISYLPLSVEGYVCYIQEILKFHALLQTEDLNQKMSDDLEKLYLHAQELGMQEHQRNLLEVGLQKKDTGFFVLEKYAQLLKNHKFKDVEVQKVRKKILIADPENKKGMLLRMALIDFESNDNKRKKKTDPRTVVQPLLDYVKQFKGKDKDNLWRVEMMIAYYFFDNNHRNAGRRHAESAFAIAPEEMKSLIKKFIVSYSTM